MLSGGEKYASKIVHGEKRNPHRSGQGDLACIDELECLFERRKTKQKKQAWPRTNPG